MRISEQQRYKTTMDRVDSARQDNAKSLEQVSTLKRINRLSDDPIGVGQVLRGRDRLKNLEVYNHNIDFSKAYLERSESAVSTISDNLIRAKELGVASANATQDAEARKATAREVKQILQEVVKLANTTHLNKFVFSGFRSNTPALSEDGQYLGDDGAIFLQVDDGDFRQVNLQARYLFEADPVERSQGHYGMTDCIERLYDGLMSDNKDDIYAALDELEFQLQKTTSYAATIGSLVGSLNAATKKTDAELVQTKLNISKIEEVDMFKATSDFHGSETVLQSTLQASNKMLQPSLLNFMQ